MNEVLKVRETARTLGVVGRILDRAGVVWWIDYGTVLGYARSGAMIPWDKDADIGILEISLRTVRDLEPAFRAEGLRFSYHPPNATRFRSGHWIHVSPPTVGVHGVDLFPWHEDADGLLHRKRYADSDRCKGREFPKDRLFPLQHVRWEGVDVWAPAEPEWFAAHRYGEDWQTPIRENNDGVRR